VDGHGRAQARLLELLDALTQDIAYWEQVAATVTYKAQQRFAQHNLNRLVTPHSVLSPYLDTTEANLSR
jgi:hypothetical protein